MKKVILLAPTPPPAGGIASWTIRMLNAKLKNNWQVGVVDEKVLGDRQIFGNNNPRRISDEIKRSFRIWNNLRKALKDESVQIVHSCIPSLTLSMMREYVCACITKVKKRKFVIHFRCTVPNTSKGRFCNVVLKHLCDKSDYIIVLNEQSYQYLKARTKTSLELVPNFISVDEICDTKHINEELKTAVYTGGVIESKGAYDIIELAKRFPQIEFRLVGKADENVKIKAAEMKNVTLTGQVGKETVLTELKNADVFIFMSYFYGEGFSNSLAEAMAVGLPCIVTDWAANKDMVGKDGGFVVDVKDVDSAMNALKSLYDPDLRRRQSVANINKVKNCYTDEIILGRYVDVYESLL